ncbi:amidohydrolase family protein [Pleionea sp. CnH1-48]|uniref:amidohydrolase family protein n=1 Tax=Pleionea sp. CnH1-48 TaxID=2954494 RepID=UPI002096CFD5|nr:amidohydrolase family protein [Pleionea sp. CnH1-48]MCO7223441.1 amidohydrolase family protein [Pleionea sp. CnH1-48]
MSLKHTFSFSFLLFFLTSSLQVFALEDSRSWLLTDVSMIDVESGTVKPGASIWIKDGMIEAINPKKTPTGIKAVSGQGRWLIPGLSEMHAHISGGEKYIDRVLKLFVAHGVTNIRGMLGQPSHLDLRQALNSGKKLGPYLVTSGPSVNGNSVRSPAEAKSKVTAQVNAGYDFHKIHPGLSPESYRAVVKTAKRLGSSWGGHIAMEVGIVGTVKAGQSTIDHIDGFIEELAIRNGGDLANRGFFGFGLAEKVKTQSIAELIKEISAYDFAIVPTETLMHNFALDKPIEELMSNPAHKWMPESTVQGWKRSRENFWSNDSVTKKRAKQFLNVRSLLIQEFQKQGVPILLGSDAPQVFNVPGDSLHKELSLMVNAGLTPLQALQAGTQSIHQFYQGKHPVGKIAKGLRADLVLLDKNPLENINNTSLIRAVVVAGKMLDRNQLDEILKSLE